MDRRKFLLNTTSTAAAAFTFYGAIELWASAAVSQTDLERDPLRPQIREPQHIGYAVVSCR
jgi:hypothetical protein